MENKKTVKILGTIQDGGLPQAGCYCQYCDKARERNYGKRYRASIALVDQEQKSWHLFEATPDLAGQMDIVKDTYPEMGLMDSIFLTHGHIGHYTGLIYLGRETLSTKNIPVYAGKKMGEVLENHIPWKQLVELKNIELKKLEDSTPVNLGEGLQVIPIEVPHRNEYTETFGFILEGPRKKLLFIPDIDSWDNWKENLKKLIPNMDYLLLDATFYSEDDTAIIAKPSEVPHPHVTKTMDLLQPFIDRGEVEVIFIHFNHNNPLVDPDSKETKEVERRGFKVAIEGMELEI